MFGWTKAGAWRSHAMSWAAPTVTSAPFPLGSSTGSAGSVSIVMPRSAGQAAILLDGPGKPAHPTTAVGVPTPGNAEEPRSCAPVSPTIPRAATHCPVRIWAEAKLGRPLFQTAGEAPHSAEGPGHRSAQGPQSRGRAAARTADHDRSLIRAASRRRTPRAVRPLPEMPPAASQASRAAGQLSRRPAARRPDGYDGWVRTRGAGGGWSVHCASPHRRARGGRFRRRRARTYDPLRSVRTSGP